MAGVLQTARRGEGPFSLVGSRHTPSLALGGRAGCLFAYLENPSANGATVPHIEPRLPPPLGSGLSPSSHKSATRMAQDKHGPRSGGIRCITRGRPFPVGRLHGGAHKDPLRVDRAEGAS